MLEKGGLAGKVVLVTGGARGIGRAIVSLFAELGASVNFIYWQSQEQAELFLREAKEKNWNVGAFQVDLREKRKCEQVVETVYEDNESLDILVNNSGIVRDNLLAALTETEIKEVLDTNVQGVFNVTQAVVPFMMSQRRGKIINISSVSAEKGGRGQTNYAASKGAINAFTKALAVELAPRKINVNAVAPGVIETDMSKAVRDLGGDEVLSHILLKRYGKPEEIANVVAFLASDYANYITGEIIHVDGGFKMA